MKCRCCGSHLEQTFLDLGSSPPSNAYLSAAELAGPEVWYPLQVMVCGDCRLVQTREFTRAEDLFTEDYAYFSGFSTSWVEHCRRYVDEMVDRLGLGPDSLVVEVACNDGTLLAKFRDRGIRCLGIEPSTSTASAARELGLEVVEEFVGVDMAERLAAEGIAADLLVANNVVAHVPDIVDFVRGCGFLLSRDGVASFEFPYLLRLVRGVQFDTIYHEHFSYLSLTSIRSVAATAGLQAFDVERVPTHGGSLRVFLQRTDVGVRPVTPSIVTLLAEEAEAGVGGRDFYTGFQERAEALKDDFLRFLLDARQGGRKVVAYGAAAKGNTLLNFAGVRPDLLGAVVDQNPAKQGRFLPGSRIPIVSEQVVVDERPDHVLILPWNLRDEVADRLDYVREWGATFVVAVPSLQQW
ncbi:MAG TPA: SAM-dependent methyltransferase [Acidimicrobiaceae bacterium]|nr:SAM-dependent methyltransferase [Acidimicrobiaceae bacterium]